MPVPHPAWSIAKTLASRILALSADDCPMTAGRYAYRVLLDFVEKPRFPGTLL